MLGDSIIYDTENSSLDRKFGQITQFGGIRLSSDFQVKRELSLDIRLLPWVVPSPGACRVTNVGPDELTKPARISEFNAVKQICKFMDCGWREPLQLITYNGIEHDDKFLREAMFRNLQNPWFASGKQTTRIDLYPLMQMIHAVEPDAFIIPFNEEGKPSFKLDRLAPANGIRLKAHDGLGDAYGCLELIKLIKGRTPWAWDYAQGHGKTAHVSGLMKSAHAAGTPLWVFTHFGEPEFVPLWPVATSGEGTFYCIDLRSDDYAKVFEDNPGKLLFKGSCFHKLAAKKLPLILTDEILDRAGVKRDDVSIGNRIEAIRRDRPFLERIAAAVGNPTFDRPVDEQAEDKFFPFMTNVSKDEMRRFVNAVNWEERLKCRFSDHRNREFAARIILDAHLHRDAVVSDRLVEQVWDICEGVMKRPFSGKDARWLTIENALEEEPDEAWLAWATTFYGTDFNHPSGPVISPPAEAVDVSPSLPEVSSASNGEQELSQLSFGF